MWTVSETRAGIEQARPDARGPESPGRLLVGMGNIYRQDDGAGLLAARELADADPEAIEVILNIGDPLSLISAWAGRETIVVDATLSGQPPGTVTCYDALAAPLPVSTFVACSTHDLGLNETVELARALDRMPGSLRVYGIEGSQFAHGTEVSRQVRAGIDRVVAEIRTHWLTDSRETQGTDDA